MIKWRISKQKIFRVYGVLLMTIGLFALLILNACATQEASQSTSVNAEQGSSNTDADSSYYSVEEGSIPPEINTLIRNDEQILREYIGEHPYLQDYVFKVYEENLYRHSSDHAGWIVRESTRMADLFLSYGQSRKQPGASQVISIEICPPDVPGGFAINLIRTDSQLAIDSGWERREGEEFRYTLDKSS